MTVSVQTAAEALTELVGAANCTVAAQDKRPYLTDYRGIFHGEAMVVVTPVSTQQVGDVVSWCYQHDVPVVPQGGNTSLMGGAVPDDTGTAVVISLRKLNRVLSVDVVNDTMTVQAGATLAAAREAAENAQRLFPLRIGSEGSCQIGGNVSTNAGGTAVLRYGNMRDLVLGIEVVLPDGRIYSSLKGLRKDNTGYDLKQLFIGAEGTLGIVTAVVLKLAPQPRATAAAFIAVKNPHAAVALLQAAKISSGNAVSAFELVSAPALELVLDYLGDAKLPLQHAHEWMVLMELTSGGTDEALHAALLDILERGFAEGLIEDAAIAASLADIQAFWRIREDISDAQTRAGGSIKCDVSVPISRIADFIDAASAEVLALDPEIRLVIYGHLGDGNVHFNPLRPRDQQAAEFLARHYRVVSETVDGLAHREQGSISAEHGIGVVKRDDLRKYKSEVELQLMWQVKRALDPKNLLNPGRVLPGPDDPCAIQ
ncbi:FAD-binding oxidoreductase [Cupriavidus plantarum]|uniref:FAD-binding oxidoreductase n=1 Tax=Cupriavidus plantarum TaxID=942865 RepID=UPI001B128E92|nr:FAD-binding oxidoreductase [Cupriavidus plantarum]CAG2128881.1 putative FAD-linked oxidoreductase [Cupriavidus plantarum]SMR66404.1 FAD/FMN-containing dehydrogenase [Cupriavidus plantarum]